MASTKGLTIEIRYRQGGPTCTMRQAENAIAKAMKGFGVPRVPHDRFDMSVDSIVGDAAQLIGQPNYDWRYNGNGLYTIIFDFTSNR